MTSQASDTVFGRGSLGVPASPSGCQPTASAADASSLSGIPNAASWPAYRTMDASGSPEAAEVVAWNWIGDLAQRERANDAVLLQIQSTPVEGGGRVTRLYRSTTLLAVATTFRDDMNYCVLVRWQRPSALAAAARRAETRSKAPSEGPQSGPQGNAQRSLDPS